MSSVHFVPATYMVTISLDKTNYFISCTAFRHCSTQHDGMSYACNKLLLEGVYCKKTGLGPQRLMIHCTLQYTPTLVTEVTSISVHVKTSGCLSNHQCTSMWTLSSHLCTKGVPNKSCLKGENGHYNILKYRL